MVGIWRQFWISYREDEKLSVVIDDGLVVPPNECVCHVRTAAVARLFLARVRVCTAGGIVTWARATRQQRRHQPQTSSHQGTPPRLMTTAPTTPSTATTHGGPTGSAGCRATRACSGAGAEARTARTARRAGPRRWRPRRASRATVGSWRSSGRGVSG